MVLAACASVPNLPYERGVGVADILRNVKCELAAAYAENVKLHPWLGNWAAGIELTLDVTEARSGGVSAQILVPIQVTDSFHMGADARRAAKAQSVASVTFSTTLAGINQAECAAFTPAKGPEPLLKGNLGLKTWVSRAAEAIEAAGIAQQTDGMGYIIEFGIEAGAGLNPGYNIIRFGDYELGGSAGLAAGREDVHTLNIAMAPMRAVAPSPVYVTNLGGPQPQTRGSSEAAGQKRQTARPATGVPQQTQQDLSNIIRSLKQSQTGRD